MFFNFYRNQNMTLAGLSKYGVNSIIDITFHIENANTNLEVP